MLQIKIRQGQLHMVPQTHLYNHCAKDRYNSTSHRSNMDNPLVYGMEQEQWLMLFSWNNEIFCLQMLI